MSDLSVEFNFSFVAEWLRQLYWEKPRPLVFAVGSSLACDKSGTNLKGVSDSRKQLPVPIGYRRSV